MVQNTQNTIKNVQRTIHTFASLRTEILRQVNAFLDEITRQSDGSQVGLWIRNTEGRPMLNGVFTGDDLADMLEAADIKKLDLI